MIDDGRERPVVRTILLAEALLLHDFALEQNDLERAGMWAEIVLGRNDRDGSSGSDITTPDPALPGLARAFVTALDAGDVEGAEAMADLAFDRAGRRSADAEGDS